MRLSKEDRVSKEDPFCILSATENEQSIKSFFKKFEERDQKQFLGSRTMYNFGNSFEELVKQNTLLNVFFSNFMSLTVIGEVRRESKSKQEY